ncbi:hypothetical protein GGI12_001387 [Dipsacomyces acuminosporus]|nr:hypothetical protein GGI12_001387 [Dipsacomyces acuminosporus]
MSSYTLRYFDAKAVAETSRVILAFGGESWENAYPAWPQEKANQPIGKLPVLVETSEDGSEFVLSESFAIEKYLATKYGIYITADAKQAARQDELRCQIKDLTQSVIEYKWGAESARPQNLEKHNAYAEAFIKYHEAALKANGSNGHYFGDKTTYVDLALYASVAVIRSISAELMPGADRFFTEENAPELSKVLKAVAAEPTLASYVASL